MFLSIGSLFRVLASFWSSTQTVLTSLRFVVILLLALIVSVILGSLIPQNATEEEYRQLFGETWFRLLRTAGLTNVYHSAWFVTGLFLLALSTLVCSTPKMSLRLARAGFTITHVSLVVLAASYAVSQAFGVRGVMQIFEGQSSRIFWERTARSGAAGSENRKAIELPFDVRLDDFRLEYYPPGPGYLIVFEADGHAHEVVAVRPQATARSPSGQYTVRILEVVPDYIYDATANSLRSRSSRFENPAVRVQLEGPLAKRVETWVYQRSPAEANRFSDQEPGRIVLAATDGVVLGTLEAREGQMLRVGQPPVQVTVARVLPHFVMDTESRQAVSRSAAWENPAALLHVVLPDATTEAFWVFARFPDFTTARSALPFAVSYQPGAESADVAALLALQRDDLPVLLRYSPGEPQIKSYISEVSVLVAGEVVHQQAIFVNGPMKYGGYTFYQQSYDAERQAYTILEVKTDPGLPGIYLGCILLCLGVTVRYTVSLWAKDREPALPA